MHAKTNLLDFPFREDFHWEPWKQALLAGLVPVREQAGNQNQALGRPSFGTSWCVHH